jgi:cobalt-zinc-cadmium efflux system outer membrane protein
MIRRWCPILFVVSFLTAIGCAQAPERAEPAKPDEGVSRTGYQSPSDRDPGHAMAASTAPGAAPVEWGGPQPVEVYIRRALAENRTVQAAFHNVRSLRHRLPQVTALDDPVASNTVFPIPSVAPQYSLMGYNPYNLTLAQQFPWYGTLRLRGNAADKDVQVALAELAAAQLDTVAAVKRAYYDLYVGQRTAEVLEANRKILEDFLAVAKSRTATGGTQQDVIRAEILINQLDRETAMTRQGLASARSALARQLHVSPETDFQTLAQIPDVPAPAEIERLDAMAVRVRPEMKGRLAAIARDEAAVGLAMKRAYPNVTLGLTYMDMEKTNAVTPKTASGFPNVGLFVAFNLPVNRAKYQAGVCEAKERALADARLYEAQRDETLAEIKDFSTQARAQQEVLGLLRDGILPRTEETARLARSDYAKGNVDYATALSAMRELLQVRLQIAQVEGEKAKALAALERAIGCQINGDIPGPPSPDAGPSNPDGPPPTPIQAGPFGPPPPQPFVGVDRTGAPEPR